VLSAGSIVVYESTVYPGVTEEICRPLLARVSGLTPGKDFTGGYSPERINPGDRNHRVHTIVKVVSGEDPKTLEAVAEVYGAIVEAGVHACPSIRVAEAAKVIENTQRDLNIALMNELALLFDRMDIRTEDVLRAAGTNGTSSLPPGLVGALHRRGSLLSHLQGGGVGYIPQASSPDGASTTTWGASWPGKR
jgi:UDP-N-acetyl-D-galactosamine dehydrogenase